MSHVCRLTTVYPRIHKNSEMVDIKAEETFELKITAQIQPGCLEASTTIKMGKHCRSLLLCVTGVSLRRLKVDICSPARMELPGDYATLQLLLKLQRQC